MKLDYCTDLDQEIVCIDTGYGRKMLDAAYLLRQGERAAFVDSGTYHCVPRFLQVLAHYGIPRTNVDYVIPTHAHLDHAGGAGELMRHLPHARLVAHPRAAPHLIDPSRVIAGTRAVYGEEGFRARFGEVVPVPAERVLAAPDGHVLELNGRRLEFIDSPGHARHHFCIYDVRSHGFFTGDTFGISYREFDNANGAFVFATTTPPQFEPQVWQGTIDRLLTYDPKRMYVTHFGCVEDVPRLAEDLRRSIRAFTDIALQAESAGRERGEQMKQQVLSHLLARLRAHGCSLPETRTKDLLAMDVELNVQGLEVWLARRHKPSRRVS
jgi:glyoxylase-like metal-dependent hydrolase (beta-lactamase superfamily II)